MSTGREEILSGDFQVELPSNANQKARDFSQTPGEGGGNRAENLSSSVMGSIFKDYKRNR